VVNVLRVQSTEYVEVHQNITLVFDFTESGKAYARINKKVGPFLKRVCVLNEAAFEDYCINEMMPVK
jgi:hypothetical protein